MEVLKEYKNCVHCGSDNLLMRGILEEGKKLGSIKANVTPCSHLDVYCNVDPTVPIIQGGRILGARVFTDICLDCGGETPVRIEKGYVVTNADPRLPPRFI